MIRISGIVRLPDDPDSGIKAVLQITNDRLTLKHARTSLGEWALPEVRVKRLSGETFEFDIAGERIHFLPSNPQLFESLEFVLNAMRPLKPHRKRTHRKEPHPAQVPLVGPATEYVVTPKTRGTRRHDEPAGEHVEIDLTAEPMRSGGLHRVASRTRHLGTTARDQLRQTGVWPLDRLKALRAEDSLPIEHEHTYGAVTIQAEIARRVCTGCGHVSLALVDDSPTDEAGRTK
ncbi:hypothetical protein BMS3Bbin01_01087 [bacterium BMS3Bbin01]|nr:hypothetical protein BMS3Bbin01_01087 [bacterium BMS3Bbin01]